MGELIQQAEKIEQEALRKAREEAERQCSQKLEKLAQQEEATRLLVELHELAKLKKWGSNIRSASSVLGCCNREKNTLSRI